MAFDFVTAKAAIAAQLQDDAGFLTAGEDDECIAEALRILSNDRPLRVVKDIAGDGTKDYAMPTEFIKGITVIKSVETPAGNDPPEFKRRGTDWFEYEDPTQSPVLRLRFKLTTPTVGDAIRLNMTTPYVLTVSSTTIDNDTIFGAVIAKSLELCFRALAARFTQTVDPTIAADAVDYTGRNAAYLLLADRWSSTYKKLAGLSEDVAAAFAFNEQDLRFETGDDLLWHSSNRR